MVRRIVLSLVVGGAILAAGARPVSAGAITFTGNVAQDFGYVGSATNPTNAPTGTDVILHSTTPIHIAQPTWMTNAGLVSGWNINSIAVAYDSTTDKLYIGVQTFGVAGNVDGNGTPGSPLAQLTAAGGSDPANFGGDKALAVGIAPLPANGKLTATNTPAPIIVAGISGNKAQAGTGLDGFNVAAYSANGSTGPGYQLVGNFGATIGTGSLAFDPSSAHPGFEFTINNFSKLLGYDPTKGFVLSAQDGSIYSVVTGKDYVPATEVTGLEAQTIPPGPPTPEPATWLAWTVVCGAGAAWKLRRSRKTGVAC